MRVEGGLTNKMPLAERRAGQVVRINVRAASLGNDDSRLPSIKAILRIEKVDGTVTEDPLPVEEEIKSATDPMSRQFDFEVKDLATQATVGTGHPSVIESWHRLRQLLEALNPTAGDAGQDASRKRLTLPASMNRAGANCSHGCPDFLMRWQLV